MSMRRLQDHCKSFRRISAVWALCALVAASSVFGNETQIAYDCFTSAEGTGYAAVGLRGVEVPGAEASEVVFLVDTSASQVGQTRHDALETLYTAIDRLPDGTMVHIMAVDVDVEPMSSTFVAKESRELGEALAKLAQRVPLGATDMTKGIQGAKASFAGRDPGTKRAVVYLGDGRSMARTMDVPVFEKEVAEYVDQRIPFIACAVGARTNLGLIGAMVNRTGGNLVDMNKEINHGVNQALETAEEQGNEFVQMPNFGQTAGSRLADSIQATVVWPNKGSYVFPENWDVYPKQLQPIRSDRETIVVAKTDAANLKDFTLKLKASLPGNEIDLAWNYAPNKAAQAANRYLVAVVDTAAKDQGATMPIVGWDSLDTIRDGFIANLADQLDKAGVAVATNNPQQALTLLDKVLQLDPNNATAKRLQKEAQDALAGGTIDQGTFDPKDSFQPEPLSSMIDSVIKEQSVSTQKVANEVRQTLNKANALMHNDPEGALQELKMTQAMVRDNTSIDPDQRNVLLDRLGNMIKQTQHQQYLDEVRRQRAAENEAAIRERQYSLKTLEENRVKAIQIFDRFTALMTAGEYKIATDVAGVAEELLPNDTTPFSAKRVASMTDYIMQYNDLRYKRHIGFVESLMVAERSFIPIPEEPPLTYIDPEQWLLLSERRKERYAVADLSQTGPADKKISKALERNIDLDLDSSHTFEDLFNMIKDKNPGINILLDPKNGGQFTTSEAVVDEPVQLHGIKLRSALSLVLSEKDLTYCIKDEVLLITSVEESKNYMRTKVYPLGDLVVDPTPIQGNLNSGSGMGSVNSGIGGGGGGMGGMGGGGGGGLGGLGGMGGGGGGGGLFNMTDSIKRLQGISNNNGTPANGYSGGGFFSIPSEPVKKNAQRAEQAIQDARKADNAREYWSAFLAREDVDQDLVKETVSRLFNQLKTKNDAQKAEKVKSASQQKDTSLEDQVIAVVESAILADAVQPWMYEAMALAQYLKGAPAKELERTLLSAADFCENPIDLMNVGLFMESVGVKERAFQMYKQGLEVMIPKQEFFNNTLRLAEELFDSKSPEGEQALQWTALAILSMEWEGKLGNDMSKRAFDLITTLQARMERSGRQAEAEHLAAQINEARLRDCIVTVEWTGEAGLDLMIREPSDSFCWFANPRTTSGGLLKTSVIGNGNSDVKRLTYICPKGFNGTYAVVVQKDWGEPTNNMVKVSIESNVVSGEQDSDGPAIRMEPDGVIVSFDLETGRRTESLEDAQLDVAELRMSVAQKQLARNNALKRLSDQSILGQVVGGSGQSSTPGSGRSSRYMPYYGPSVVGYRPIIIWLDQGGALTTNAVVSADRRYVRMSPAPQFSDIRKIVKYNIATGAESASDSSSGSGSGSGSGSSN